MSNLEWNGVPSQHSDAWRKLFNQPRPNEGAHLASACPACGATNLYRYYALGRLQPRVIDGKKYMGPGSYWEWCSNCRSFEHMSRFVPEWWQIAPLNVDHTKLTAIPDVLDAAIAAGLR